LAGDDQNAGQDEAVRDFRALSIITAILAGLALLSVVSLWYELWTLGPPDNNWMYALPGGLGGVLEPLLAGLGVWLWWFARRTARRHGLRAWTAYLALAVCLAATASWAVWMIWFSSEPI
jgi:hypothetical protein